MSEHSTGKDAPTGDAHGSDAAHHHIVGGEFVCSAPEDAKCRTFPTCECENWCCCDTPGELHDPEDHCCMVTVKPGQGCWMAVWVDAVGLADSINADYDDDGEPILSNGPVTCDWDDGIHLTRVTPPGEGRP